MNNSMTFFGFVRGRKFTTKRRVFSFVVVAALLVQLFSGSTLVPLIASASDVFTSATTSSSTDIQQNVSGTATSVSTSQTSVSTTQTNSSSSATTVATSSTDGNATTDQSTSVATTTESNGQTSSGVSVLSELMVNMNSSSTQSVSVTTQSNSSSGSTHYPTTGTVRVCKVIAKSDGSIAAQPVGLPAGNFSLAVSDIPTTNTRISNFSAATFSPDTDLLNHDGIMDADCVSFTGMAFGSYVYDREQGVGEDWQTPLYNDQEVTSIADFYPYQATNTSALSITKSDGIIEITKYQPAATIVVLNRAKVETTPLNQKPVITVLGANPATVIVGTSYTDQGATAFDLENGTITSRIIATGTVNTAVVGTYTITYNVTDLNGLAADQVVRTVNVVAQSANGIKLTATAIKCEHESDLPNWGAGAADISSTTATSFLATHPACHPIDNWNFEWGNQAVTNPGDGYYWDAGTQLGWTMFGPTNIDGVAHVTIPLTAQLSQVRVREVLESGYIPFTYGTNGGTNSNNVSAELYCANDAINYDNFDFVSNLVSGKEYFCVAFNAKSTTTPLNQKPVITVLGANPATVIVGTSYTDQGATAFDLENGTITSRIIATGTVNTAVVGTYTITYNVTDLNGLAADQVVRTVNVVAQSANQRPVITLVGSSTVNITIGSVYVDQGATAFDLEDGTITPSIIATSTVNTSLVGAYTVTYNVKDSKGLAAQAVTRTVNVIAITECTDSLDNDGDGKIDYPADLGCDGITDTSENSAPVITVLGDNPRQHLRGTVYVDQGATAFDLEDGTITPRIISTGNVDVNIIGSYSFRYNATDTKGLAATEKVRVINVVQTLNQKPVITVLGANPATVIVGTSYTDQGATAFDLENGTITSRIIATGTVNTAVVGTYTITYNVTDLNGLAADQVVRTVNVVAQSGGGGGGGGGGGTPQACSDGSDNDGDGLADYPRDPGCSSSSDNSETDGGPVITIVGANPATLTVGTSYSDQGATATDPEDGDITGRIVSSSTVNISTVGTYAVTYNVADSAGNKADPKVRTVNVVAQSAGGGGGGGGGSVSLSLFNEKIFALSPTSVRVTWDTNYSADSRVVYGLSTRTIGSAPLYGYAYTTATDTQSVIAHSQVITGLATGTTYYFRPVSSSGGSTLVGIELKREEVPAACMYLKEYLRINIPNNPDEVTKLQSFLKGYEGFSGLSVTGRFDETTDAAVRTFQLKYKGDVLAPWNLTDSTGYVYYTTQKKINEIYCQRAFPLNEYQKSEIESFKVLLDQLNQSSAGSRGSVSGGDNVVTLPIVGVNTGSSGVGGGTSGRGEVAGVKTETGEDRMTNVSSSSSPSKIALSDLLATVPNVSSSLSQSHANDGEIGSSTSVDKGDNALTRGLASVSSAAKLKFGGVLGAHPMISLALLLLALVLLLLYVRQWRINRKGREGDPLLNI